MRTTKTFDIEDIEKFKTQVLNWSKSMREVVFLDSNRPFNEDQLYQSYDFVLAVDAFTSIQTDEYQAFEKLKQYQQTTKDWIFGYLSYDLKNDTEDLISNNTDTLNFPDLFFFQPRKLIFGKKNKLEFQYLFHCDDEIDDDFEQILKENPNVINKNEHIKPKANVSFEDYTKQATVFLDNIQKGNIYEANYCINFFADDVTIEPLSVYNQLNTISRAPFSVYLKNNKNYLMSASPERFLKKTAFKIISQPIKGTSKRHKDIELDEKSKNDLMTNPKERAENIMITDLVRNDLSKTATPASVVVEELCKIYTFKQVHQMISTIVSEINPETNVVDLIKTMYPMGSMTGAPKIAAMQLIEQLETTKRGLYSGSVGYFSPDNDFDFNVVIRSILYNESNKHLSFHVGSAITATANPEDEFYECMLKAKAMIEVLGIFLIEN